MNELVIVAAPPGTTVQDAGRFGWLHAGVPPSGPLDVTAHAAANLAVGNESGEAAIEIPLGGLRLRSKDPVAISIDGAPPIQVVNELDVPAHARAVRYLAVYGGIDVPVALGSRATLLPAQLGGLAGRALRAGDRLPIGSRAKSSSPRAAPTVTDPSDTPVLEVLPGPHLTRFPAGALDAFLAATWGVSARSDRVGVRLEGPPVPRYGDDRAPPVPMVRGAIQVTTDGTPIVLGPDHPVTGGYPVIAVVGGASQAVLARLRAKRTLRFALSQAWP